MNYYLDPINYLDRSSLNSELYFEIASNAYLQIHLSRKSKSLLLPLEERRIIELSNSESIL